MISAQCNKSLKNYSYIITLITLSVIIIFHSESLSSESSNTVLRVVKGRTLLGSKPCRNIRVDIFETDIQTQTRNKGDYYFLISKKRHKPTFFFSDPNAFTENKIENYSIPQNDSSYIKDVRLQIHHPDEDTIRHPEVHVKGYVKDSETNSGLSNAIVAIDGVDGYTITNNEGFFYHKDDQIKDFSDLSIIGTKYGYKTINKQIEVFERRRGLVSNDSIIIELEPIDQRSTSLIIQFVGQNTHIDSIQVSIEGLELGITDSSGTIAVGIEGGVKESVKIAYHSLKPELAFIKDEKYIDLKPGKQVVQIQLKKKEAKPDTIKRELEVEDTTKVRIPYIASCTSYPKNIMSGSEFRLEINGNNFMKGTEMVLPQHLNKYFELRNTSYISHIKLVANLSVFDKININQINLQFHLKNPDGKESNQFSKLIPIKKEKFQYAYIIPLVSLILTLVAAGS